MTTEAHFDAIMSMGYERDHIKFTVEYNKSWGCYVACAETFDPLTGHWTSAHAYGNTPQETINKATTKAFDIMPERWTRV